MSSGRNINVDCSYILCPKKSDIQACNGPFPLSDKILKKIEIGKNITIA